MTDQAKEPAGGGPHLAPVDRRTLDAIFHHPVPHNLSWMDTLHLLTHLGSAEEMADGKSIVHAHVVIGRSDGTTAGGHLLEASVRPTCEVFLTESPGELAKAFDPDSGLVLIKV